MEKMKKYFIRKSNAFMLADVFKYVLTWSSTCVCQLKTFFVELGGVKMLSCLIFLELALLHWAREQYQAYKSYFTESLNKSRLQQNHKS